MPRVLMMLVAVLIVVVAGGCGGDEGDGKASAKQVYAQQLAEAGKPLQAAFADTDQVGANITSAQIISNLDKEAAVIEDTVTKIEAITPPAGLEPTHQKLVDGLEDLAKSFRNGAKAARRNDTKTLTTALRKLRTSEGVKKLTEAQADLKKQGVTVTNASE